MLPSIRKYYIKYKKAEDIDIDNHSVDLITVANALHWFNFEAFYSQVQRVLKPDEIIAAWCYASPIVSPEIDQLVKKFNDEYIDTFWQAENRLVKNEYRELPFPFQEISSPQFYSERPMNLAEFIKYLNTWSATQKYINQHQHNPTDALLQLWNPVWGDADAPKTIKWKLVLKVGRT